MDAVDRAAATAKTLAKYRTRAFSWSGRATCVHMARTHLRNMGHRPPPVPDFRSALGARRALQKAGFDSVEALLDSLLPRIAPAEAWVGDLALLEGDDGFDSIMICTGGPLLGWHSDDGSGVKPLIPLAQKAAWRA